MYGICMNKGRGYHRKPNYNMIEKNGRSDTAVAASNCGAKRRSRVWEGGTSGSTVWGTGVQGSGKGRAPVEMVRLVQAIYHRD